MIIGKLVNLRTVREEDIDEIFLLSSDLEHRGEYLDVRLPSQVVHKKRFLETGLWNDDFGTMIITDKNGRMVGDITYFKGVWYLPGYEIGYRIFRNEDKGKGYTSEALRIFSRYLFEVRPINRLEIQVSKNNIPSRRVAEKCGFSYEGLKRQAVFTRGKYEDIELFALIREDLKD